MTQKLNSVLVFCGYYNKKKQNKTKKKNGWLKASQVMLVVKNAPANAGDLGSIPRQRSLVDYSP